MRGAIGKFNTSTSSNLARRVCPLGGFRAENGLCPGDRNRSDFGRIVRQELLPTTFDGYNAGGFAARTQSGRRTDIYSDGDRTVMGAALDEKTDRYETLLSAALDAAEIAPQEGTPLYEAALEYREMAQAYLEDGRHFRQQDDLVNALASFSYGHGWMDAGARIGVFEVPTDGHLFTV